VRLSLYPGLVDEDAGVGVEAGKGKAYVRVDETDLGRGDARVLELHGRALLAAEHDDVMALDTNSAGSCRDPVSWAAGRRVFGWGAPLLTASPAYST